MNLLNEKVKGTVIRYIVDKKFGFIKPDGIEHSGDVFIHVDEIDPEHDYHKKLVEGDRVIFDLYRRNENEKKRGLVAHNLTIVGSKYSNEGDVDGNTI